MVVRVSKFRHVFGTSFKLELQYQDMKTYTSAWDSDYIKANRKFFAVNWQVGGGGSLAVFRHADTGKKTPDVPTLSGHSAAILDFDFNPFNDHIVATGSEDTTVKIWGIPEDGLTTSINTPLVTLDRHSKKVGTVKFNPTANNILTTAALDTKVKIWDIEQGVDKLTIDSHTDTVQSLSWNLNGSQFVTTCKDKKVRIIDPRQGVAVAEVAGHQGTKGSRAVWMGKKDKIFTVGFSKMTERQYMFWDPRNMAAPLGTTDIDVASGLIMPFFDEDSSVLFLAGKGDGNIRYYEVVDREPWIYFLSEYKDRTPQRGMCMLPKTAVDVSSCEVVRLLKIEDRNVVPIMFQVPRKADSFQEDLYPETAAPEATVSADEWFAGQNGEPKYVSMRPGENNFASSTVKMSDFVPKVAPRASTSEPASPKPDASALQNENQALKQRVAELEALVAELQAAASASTSEN